MSAVIEVQDLRKEYGALTAVDGISFEIGEGEVYALLGENGAGKSTTVEVLEGHRKRTSGEVAVLGTDPGRATRDFHDRIGIVLQTSGVEHELTVRERWPSRISTVVDLPAPLWPSRAYTSPSATSNERPSTAFSSP